MKAKLSLAVAIAMALPVYAQEHVTELGSVIVTATRFDQTENTTPTIVNQVTAEQIEKSGAKNIADVLRVQPGVQVRDITGSNNRVAISMRGFGQNSTSNVLIMVNGRRLNNQTQEPANLNLIALHDIERIEIIQGSAGSLYGDQAVGGVINIITKPIIDSQGRVSVSQGTDDHEEYTLAYSKSFENGFGLRLSAESQNSDNYRDNSATGFNSFFAEIEKVYDTGRVFVELQKVEDEVQFPYALDINQIRSDRRQSSSSDYLNFDSDMFLLGLEQDISDNWKLLGEYSVQDNDGKGIFGGPYIVGTEITTFTPRIMGKVGGAIYTVGYDFHETDYQRGGWAPQERNQEVNAVYARAQFPIQEDLELTLGGRESRVKDKDLLNKVSNRQSRFVKEIGLTYQLSDKQRLFLRRDESIRFANMDDLASASPAPGKEFLEPQESVSHELGWEWKSEGTQLQGTIFQLDLDNEIKLDPLPYVNVNLEKSRRRGLVVSASHLATDNLRLSGNYTFTDSEIKAGTHAGNEVPYVPKHTFVLSANYQLDSHTSLYIDANYTGTKYLDDDEANAKAKVGAYTIVNANVSWKKENWDASLRINNLLDKEYDAYSKDYPWYVGGVAYYPAAERQIYLTLGYNF